MSSLWKDVNRKQVCPICGKPDWCRMSADGQWAICRRLDTGDGHRKVDKSGAEYWVYHFHGHITPTSIPPMPPSVVTLGRATDDHLHQVYGVLLRSLPLTSQHHTQLSQRGLTERDISFRHYGSLPQQGRSRLAKALVERFGEPLCTRVPGLYIREEGQRRWWSLAGAAGLVIPVRNVAGQIIALSVRSDDPDAASRYSAISSTKHRGPGPGAPIHVPLIKDRDTSVIRLTEGALKADVATALSGLLTIGLPGVSMSPSVLPSLQHLRVSVVHVAFDMDAGRNYQVAMALRQTARRLRAEGFDVQLEVWDELDGKGIDDLLASGQQPEILTGAAMTAELTQMVRSARFVDPLQIAKRWEVKQQRYIQRLRLPVEVEVDHGHD